MIWGSFCPGRLVCDNRESKGLRAGCLKESSQEVLQHEVKAQVLITTSWTFLYENSALWVWEETIIDECSCQIPIWAAGRRKFRLRGVVG